ncbi:hypothetical protein [Anaerotignum sp.]
MRKRKCQTIVFILSIGLLSFTYVRLNKLFFSPEEVFYACERGLRSGPSEEIVQEFVQEDGSLLLVGRQKEDLFVASAEKHLGIFWKMKSGGVHGLFPVEKEFDGYLMQDGKYIGLCLNPEITEIRCIAGSYSEQNWQEYSCQVGEDGFFFCETGLDGTENYDVYEEGRNADGEVLYTMGDGDLAESLRRGRFTPEAKEVTKPFSTAPTIE